NHHQAEFTDVSKTSSLLPTAETASLLPERLWNVRSAGCRASLPDASDATSRGRQGIRRHNEARAADQKSYSPQLCCGPDRSDQDCGGSGYCSTSSADGP